jgi:hypothetical protein
VTHDEMVAEIQRRARLRGLLSHYCKRGERCEGDPGLPDIVFPRGWIEVKTLGCPTLSSGQKRWRYALLGAGQLYEVMHEYNLEPGGAVDQFLEFLATGRVL